jgi:hypothetical protein
MMDRSFVFTISERALGPSVEHIGTKLLELDGQGVYSAARPLDAVLHHLTRGVRDDVLLKTNLEPTELENLLRTNLGSDYKLCAIRWVG